MSVKIERNFPPLTTLPLTDRPLMREVGLLARERIYRRTVAGRDMDDQPFTPYSAGYAARKGAELGRSHVTLQVSGGMLNAIQVLEAGDDYVILGYA